MKLKQLREILSDVETFSSPNFKLEQYPTGPEIAAHGIFFFFPLFATPFRMTMHYVVLYTIHNTFDDVEDCVVADFGCGTGILGIGAVVLGCR